MSKSKEESCEQTEAPKIILKKRIPDTAGIQGGGK